MRFIHTSLITIMTALSCMAHADTQRVTTYTGMLQKPAASAAKANITGSFTNQRISERMALIQFAKTFIGTPYLYGGNTPKGFDCSGLVRFVFAKLGHELPRVSAAQYQALKPIDKPKIGDLVFFGRGNHVTHVGIVVDHGKMLHAPSSGKTVTIDNYTSGYWGKRYLGARTVVEDTKPQYAAATPIKLDTDSRKKRF